MSILSDLFKRDDAPGPGVAPDEPRKKGIRRLWEVCTRDIGSFFWAGLAALAALLPWAGLTTAALLSRALAAVALAGAVGGMVAAPFLCALADLVLRGLRDEPFYGRRAWLRALRGSLRACLLPGGVFGAAAALEWFAVQIALGGGAPGGLLWGVLLGMALAAGFAPYLCAQIVLFEQPLGRSLKNSCLLFLYGLPRSLGAAALLLGYAAGVALFAPLSYLVLILGNAWLPLAAALLMIYQPMERALGLEEQIRAAQTSRRAKVAPAAPSQAAASKSSPSRRLAPNQNRSTIQG